MANEYENRKKRLHISSDERTKWDKNCTDLLAHLGAGGIENHPLANGTTPGFSTENFTTELKKKLDGIEAGALNNPYPGHIPYSDITGLSVVGHTGNYKDLVNVPETFIAGGGNADTVGGITLTIGPNQPSNPISLRNLWIDTTNRLVKVYVGTQWISMCAVYA